MLQNGKIHPTVSAPAGRKPQARRYGAKASFLGSAIGRRPACVLSNFCLGLSLFGHLRQMTTSGVDEPIADLLSMSINWCIPQSLDPRTRTDLANSQACAMHEKLFLFFGRIRVCDVILKPSPHDICDRFGQVSSAALVFRLTEFAAGVVVERVLPVRATVHERRAIRVLRGWIRILSRLDVSTGGIRLLFWSWQTVCLPCRRIGLR